MGIWNKVYRSPLCPIPNNTFYRLALTIDGAKSMEPFIKINTKITSFMTFGPNLTAYLSPNHRRCTKACGIVAGLC